MSVHLRRDLRIVHHAIRVGYPVDMEKLERKLSSSKQDSVADRSDDRVRRHVMEAVSLQAARLLAGLCREQRGERGVHSMELCQSGEAGNSRAPLGIVAARRLSVGQVLGFYPGCIFPADEDPPRSDKLFANEYEGVYIDGDELFWNYRLTPRATAAEATFPSWYAPVDEDAFESAVLGVSSSGQSAQRV